MLLKHCFPPVVDAATRLLILGSLPGEASLAAARYYAHPRNQFWLLVGEIIGIDLVSLGYEERLRRLQTAGIGLWDVVASASREGSLDMRIRGHVPNDLASLADGLPDLRAIAFNGSTAARIGRRMLAARGSLRLIDLPSSSPARTLPLQVKLQTWRTLRTILSEGHP